MCNDVVSWYCYDTYCEIFKWLGQHWRVSGTWRSRSIGYCHRIFHTLRITIKNGYRKTGQVNQVSYARVSSIQMSDTWTSRLSEFRSHLLTCSDSDSDVYFTHNTLQVNITDLARPTSAHDFVVLICSESELRALRPNHKVFYMYTYFVSQLTKCAECISRRHQEAYLQVTVYLFVWTRNCTRRSCNVLHFTVLLC